MTTTRRITWLFRSCLWVCIMTGALVQAGVRYPKDLASGPISSIHPRPTRHEYHQHPRHQPHKPPTTEKTQEEHETGEQRVRKRRLKSKSSSKSYHWYWYKDDDCYDDKEEDIEDVIPECQSGGELPTPLDAELCNSTNFLESRDEFFQKQPIVGNLTYDDLASLHALWLFDREDYASTSPSFDLDGSLNQQDSGVEGVQFLTPNGEPTACLTTNISSADVIFFDISAAIYLSFPSDTEEDWFGPLRSFADFAGFPNASALTEEEVTLTAARLTTAFEQNLTLRVFLDGCELDARSEYAVSDIFRLSNESSFEVGTYGAAGGFYGALGPLPAGQYVLRIVVMNTGINFAADPSLYTMNGTTLETFQVDNEFRLIVIDEPTPF